MKKSKVLNLLWDYFLMTVGSVIFCMAWTSFIIPTGLASGGLTGLCTIIEYATNGAIPMGIPYWIMNIGLLIVGFLSLGRAFGIKTIYVIILTSILFNVLPEFEALKYYGFVENDEKLLAALIGAALEAVGLGLVLLRGGSSGGTDIIAMIINKYWPVSPGRVYLYTDIFIIASLFLLPDKGLIDVVYAYIIMLGFSFGIDFVLLGNKSSVQILVFSSKYQEIADHMIHVMHRGVTALQSVGWYSQTESKVLLIVSRKHQMNEVIKDVKAIDPKAFVSVSTAMSVFGEGFEEVKTGINLKKTNKIEEEK
jgi:uncharacterized membrane-anchored protein YitT (DUF2179 family)